MCNGYFTYLFPPQTDETTTKCCPLARLISAEVLEEVRRPAPAANIMCVRKNSATISQNH